ncbi:MAG TPA: vWA domain-containing protein [Myxococcota bacterium]
MTNRARLLLAALALAGCQAPPPPAPPAELSIEIVSGYASRPPVPAPEAERVELLVDVTASLRAGTAGAERFRAARRAASRFLTQVPAQTRLGVRALGVGPRDGCQSPTLLTGGRRERTRAGLAARVDSLQPAGEGSLAVALAELRGELVASGELRRSRVVVFTDLGSECGGDLCTAAELLIDDGVRLDFVVLGDAAAPACFAELPVPEPPADPPPLLPSPGFQIVAYDPGPEREPFLLAEGSADGTRRRVPAGPVTVLLGFEPPSLIGPLVLSPGTWTHIRVVEFPALDPPVREWAWSTFPLAAGARAPR